jgi:hypothetical protein
MKYRAIVGLSSRDAGSIPRVEAFDIGFLGELKVHDVSLLQWMTDPTDSVTVLKRLMASGSCCAYRAHNDPKQSSNSEEV